METGFDQGLRALCAHWLGETGTSEHLRALLGVKLVEARLVALALVPDEYLKDEELLPLLADRSPRVRENAQWRCRKRGIDAADWYRKNLQRRELSTSERASSLAGLSAVGGRVDLDLFRAHLRHGSPVARASAAAALGRHETREGALTVLAPLLLDSSSRVATMAARLLARFGAPVSTGEAAWGSAQPWSRRAAWRLCRAVGSWDRVEADLRASTDEDPEFRALGIKGIRTWLATSAATTWAVVTEDRRTRIRALLDRSGLDGRTRKIVAFHAGVSLPSAPSSAPDNG